MRFFTYLDLSFIISKMRNLDFFSSSDSLCIHMNDSQQLVSQQWQVLWFSGIP